MGFKLPRLTREVDCGPLGYPGLRLVFWLNATDDEWKPPQDAQPWDRFGYHQLSRMLEAVVIPGEYTEDGEEQRIDITDRKAAYELEQADGFDPAILVWAVEAWRQQRLGWLQSESKN